MFFNEIYIFWIYLFKNQLNIKMRLFKTPFYLLLLLPFLNTFHSFCQTKDDVKMIISNYNFDKINQLYLKTRQKENVQYERAKNYANENNIPLFQFNKNGSFSQLMKINELNIPIYYSLDNVNAAISTRVPFLRSGGGLGLNLQGNTIIPRIWDGGAILTTHQEYNGRVTAVDETVRNSNSFHAIHVCGTICATGVNSASKGMAPLSTVRSFEWTNDESEAIVEASNGMILSNHSYGTPIAQVSTTPWYIGAYTPESFQWDEIAYNFPYYLPIFSAGNDGTTTNPNPIEVGYDKLIGNKVAKNILTIANANDATVNTTTGLITGGGTINGYSSQGPSDDFRIKPDVTGNGTSLTSTGNGTGTGGSNTSYTSMSGTSMAAPNVTGTLVLLQELNKNLFGRFMKASTLKGIVCHTATDRGNAGPDAKFGWGYVNAKFAAETIMNNGLTSWVSEETISQGQTIVKQFTATGGTIPFSASATWTDFPLESKINRTSTLNESIPDLTNDLDVRVTQASNTFFPWKLGNTPSALAIRNADNVVDNVERVDIDSPIASGVYTVTVSHKGTLESGKQDFSLVVTGVTSNFAFKCTNDVQTICSNTADAIFNLGLTKNGGSNVVFSVLNAPTNATIVFSANNFSASSNFTLTFGNLVNVPVGKYIINISATNGIETEIRQIMLTVYHNAFTSPILLSPINNAENLTTATQLQWQSDLNATSWNVQVSSDSNFNTLTHNISTTTNSITVVNLVSNSTYYWRVKPSNSCGNGSFSSANLFKTAIIDCSPNEFVATDFTNGTILNIANISPNLIPITVSGGLKIGKITASVGISHTYIQDLTIKLIGPASIGSPEIELQREWCGDNDGMLVTYDDSSNQVTTTDCNATVPGLSGTFKPVSPLYNLDNLLADGVWNLSVLDPYNGDGGAITSFKLKICNKEDVLSTNNFDNFIQSIYFNDNNLVIKTNKIMNHVKLFDISGKKIAEFDAISSNIISKPVHVNDNQIYFVKINYIDNMEVNEKIVK